MIVFLPLMFRKNKVYILNPAFTRAKKKNSEILKVENTTKMQMKSDEKNIDKSPMHIQHLYLVC